MSCNCEFCNDGRVINSILDKLSGADRKVIEHLEIRLANAETDSAMSDYRIKQLHNYLGDDKWFDLLRDAKIIQ